MKILKKSILKASVYLEMIPEDIDDIYAMYRIVEPKDKVKSISSRSIPAETTKSKSRVSLLLEVLVESVTVDLDVGILFVKGKIMNETQHTKVGTYHTIDIPVNHRFSVEKQNISPITLSMLQELTQENKAESAYLLCRKDTYSLILSSKYVTKRVFTFPKEKSKVKKEKSFISLSAYIKESVKLLVVAGDDKEIQEIEETLKKIQNLKKILLFIKKPINSENSYKGDQETIKLLISLPNVLRQMSAARYGKEIIATNSFFLQEEKKEKGTCTGQKETLCAAEHFLIKQLILVDSVIKSSSPEERERIEKIISLTKQGNAEILVLSEHTPAGEQVLSRGGAVAILTHPNIDLEHLQ
ncbi:protein pelota [Nematocida sp. LUAm3]|nr:protein pelota [Nematocida sp. LUAm3]KAI5173869.1 protein pelota [Nematocida sp. LUAm2]KAI5177386.1 protein pelota [Nematocida sp. LUAm1]